MHRDAGRGFCVAPPAAYPPRAGPASSLSCGFPDRLCKRWWHVVRSVLTRTWIMIPVCPIRASAPYVAATSPAWLCGRAGVESKVGTAHTAPPRRQLHSLQVRLGVSCKRPVATLNTILAAKVTPCPYP